MLLGVCKQIDVLKDVGINSLSQGIQPSPLFRSQPNRFAGGAFEVARGTLKIVPLEGQEKNHVEVFGKEIGKGEAWGSRKDLHGFLLDLEGFLGRRFVNEAKSGKEEVFTYGLSVRQNPRQRLASERDIPSPLDPVPLPKFDPAIEAEDRDPKLVLPNVAKQTGLTFTTEKRKVRVLFVRKSDK